MALTAPIVGGKGTVPLPEAVFGVEAAAGLLHEVVTAENAGRRQGTHATKTRGMVAGGRAKPFRQKGTGRARQGTTRAPQFTGGGAVFGPQPRSYAVLTFLPKWGAEIENPTLAQTICLRLHGHITCKWCSKT